MEKTRWVLLVLLAVAIAVVVAGYRATQRRNLLLAPAKPARLPGDLNALSKNWSWSHSSKDRPVVQAKARDYRQLKDSSRLQLDDVEIKVFSKTGETYDLIRSRQAEFDTSAEKLYSEGEVTIIIRLPASGPPSPEKRYVEIHTSGLTYDNKTAVSSTDRPVRFQFEDGDGRSLGAVYDSANRYLWMKNDVEVNRHAGPSSMRIRAGELHYREAEQKIELRPWSSLERGHQGVEAAASTVFLDKGDLKKIEASQGRGWDLSPGREVRFRGNWLEVNFTPEQTVATATGLGGAQMVSQSTSGVTKVSGGRVDLEFTTPKDSKESELSIAHVREQARVESVPDAVAETRVLSAEGVKLVMRPGGRDVQSIETLSPGKLEFVPSSAGQRKRILTSERISAQYLPGNHIEKLGASGRVHVRNDPPEGSAKLAPRLTWSDDLEALFDPQTGETRELRQWSNFRFEEGPRQATANRARFDLPNDRITLDTAARVWDESGMTTADILVLDQKQDRFEAEGKVMSAHQDKPAARSSEGLFSSDKPLNATAHRLESKQRNHVLDYRGEARLWQEGNSIRADEIHLDRQSKTLSAHGNVVSVLVDSEQQPNIGAQPKTPAALVTVTSDSLEYADENRRAYYTGNVRLRRERMTIRAAELEAFLRPNEQVDAGESRLERAVARRRVEILETPTVERRGRRAYAEQAEYFSGEEKVILRGGLPTIEEPDRGFTRGEELTYHIDDDRLLVSGRPGARTQTQQRLKRK